MILYKKDTAGRIRTLAIYPEGEYVVQISGLENGKKVKNKSKCAPKNVGKSNATSAEEQAVKEYNAKCQQKKDEGYFTEREKARTTIVIAPMLAKVYEKEERKIEFDVPTYVQPKLDGMRSLGPEDDYLLSRLGKKIENLEHIYDDLNKLRKGLGHVPDGELYVHGKSFQENMKLIKKYRPGETEQIKWHVYDCISSEPFYLRMRMMEKLFSMHNFASVVLVPSYLVSSKTEIFAYHSKFLADGYEGTIVRHGLDGYKLKGRSSSLLKLKDFQDIAAKVVGVIPSEKRPEQGLLVCEMPDGQTFKASLKYSFAEREEILQNKGKYIGQTAECRHILYTDKGIPRNAVCVGFRLDK